MTNDLDALRAALKQMPPPDLAAKEATVARAMKNFDALQGSPSAPRPNQDRPPAAGFLNGVYHMLSYLTSRPILTAATSATALCVSLIAVLPLTKTPIITAPNLPALEATTQDTPAPPPAVKPSQSSAQMQPKARPETAVLDATIADQPPLENIGEPEAMGSGQAEFTAAVAPLARQNADTAKAPAPASGESFALGEVTPNAGGQIMPDNTEAFANTVVNPIKITTEEPVSTFSIDVDTASYSVIRQSLNSGVLPPPEAVRIEEMINYFPYAYPAPKVGEEPFKSTITVMQTPWNPGTKLVHIGLQGRLPALADRPPLNLVLLIDTSGSMDEPNKLPLLKKSLKLLLSNLRPEDEIAIVAYAGSAGEILPPTKAEQRSKILAALDNLAAGGATAGAEGLALAYQVAEKMGGADQVSRILLATDGDFNLGIDDPAGLASYIAKQRDTGVYLSVLGFGRGNLDDATMQALAQNGNGTAAYIDTLSEARKLLVDQLSGALFPIANDVKIQIEWNPATVAEYRLIGYETRALQREDFNNDRVDAGEIGAGHSVTAIYEVTPPNSPALRSDPLRYGTAQHFDNTTELGFLRLRYKAPGNNTSVLIESPIAPETTIGTDDARFAVAIAGFGQLLTRTPYIGQWSWDQAIDMALNSRSEDQFGYRVEAINLMRMAKGLTNH